MAAVAFPFLRAPWREGLKVSCVPLEGGSEIFCLLDRRPDIVGYGAATGVAVLSLEDEEGALRFLSTCEAGVEVELVPAAGDGATEPAGWVAWLAAWRAEDLVILGDMS